MGLSGLDGIRQIEDKILEIPKVASRAATDAAERVKAAIENQFARGIDPYGVPWEPLADSTLARGRTPPPLTDTGALAASVEVVASSGAGITATIGEDYGIYHQTGTSRMPQRQILPDESDFEVSLWAKAIAEAYADAFASIK